MAVTSTAPPDEDIRREVLTELKFDAQVRPSEIGVIVDDQVATLTGWVDSLPKKWAAERAALRVRGVIISLDPWTVPVCDGLEDGVEKARVPPELR
jgi:hypothetical protein